ncbi:MAG: hypothetical protein ACOYZ6_08055 [Chloroflexota bacterium]
MKVNRWLVFVIVVIVAAFFVMPAFAQGAEPPVGEVTLPTELEALLAAGIGFLVTAGLKSLSILLGKDLSGWAAVITASIVTTVVYFFNALLSAVPPEAAPSVAIALTLLVSILSAFGIHKIVKGFQPVSVVMKK